MEIHNIEDFAGHLSAQRSGHALRVFYRGEPECETPLLPRLLRPGGWDVLSKAYRANNPVDLQSRLLGRLRRYADLSETTIPRLSELKFGDALCIAQHHGLPTLLLDWTLDPLAALFFAVTSIPPSQPSGSAKVWWMKLRDRTERETMTVHLENSAELNERTDHPIVVVPRPLRHRIRAQVGRFTYSGKYDSSLTSYKGPSPWLEIGSWKVGATAFEPLRTLLRDVYQIHEGSIFGGVDDYARHLAGGGL